MRERESGINPEQNSEETESERIEGNLQHLSEEAVKLGKFAAELSKRITKETDMQAKDRYEELVNDIYRLVDQVRNTMNEDRDRKNK